MWVRCGVGLTCLTAEKHSRNLVSTFSHTQLSRTGRRAVTYWAPSHMSVKSISLKVLYMNCNILIYSILWMMFQLMYVSTDEARFYIL